MIYANRAAVTHSTYVAVKVSSRKHKRNARSGRARERQQVAAVCYRIGTRGIEFLLVQTRGGRWIFPKGGVEPGLTQAQSAALEAFEEAGAHGRIEEMPFARYHLDASSDSRQSSRSESDQSAVTAHLCEVTHLEPPQEANRRPTWFSPEKAKRSLCKDRNPQFGKQLAHIIDRAASRVQRLKSQGPLSPGSRQKDALQQVRFEAYEGLRWQDVARDATLLRHLLQGNRSPSAAHARTHTLRLRAPHPTASKLQLVKPQL